MAEQISVTKSEYILMELSEVLRGAQKELQAAMVSPDIQEMGEAMRLMVIVKLLTTVIQAIGSMG